MLLFDFMSPEGFPRRLSFGTPVETIVAHSLDEVRPALRAVQRAASAGLYAAGYVAYEAAPAFDTAYVVSGAATMPLLWFGLFAEPRKEQQLQANGSFHLSDWQPATSRATYDRHVAAVRAAIGRGETYQTNYTLRLKSRFSGDDVAWYEQLRSAQRGGFCAYLNLGRFRVLSASPELFFRLSGDRLVTRPMKGTVRRGRWPEEDHAHATWLARSEKNKAENLMIVDLLRNDLGRIARTGSVEVPALFTIERYRTVHQMTSTVEARVLPGTTLEEVFTALFPCGSITGAPKISTMRLIAALEETPRNVYCGAIGMVLPGGEAVFNVAIRTVVIDTETRTAEYGVGGGITWDSTAEDEYAELLDKAALLQENWPAFDLLETLRLEHGNYALLQRHLQRLEASARYFDVPLNRQAAEAALLQHAHLFPAGTRRVRLRVNPEGGIRVESVPLEPLSPQPCPVALAADPISRHNRWLFHKTTNRGIYDSQRAARPDVWDVLLWNEEGELTEFTIGNLVVRCDGGYWTPPLDCGLLAGTLRADLLERGIIRERVLKAEDLERATGIWLINSVREWVPVLIVP